MKKYVVLFICLIVSFMTFGQNRQTELKEIRVTPPKYTGIVNEVNEKSLTDYLLKNIEYKTDIDEAWDEGTEIVRFVVTPNGKLTDFKVINSVSNEIDEELIRVLQSTDGMWAPGLNDKEPIAMEKEISIMFSIFEPDIVKERFTAIATRHFIKGTKKLFLDNKPKKALKAFNKATMYLPYDEALLYARSMAKFISGDKEGARIDWNRMKLIAKNGKIEQNLKAPTDDFKALNGYEEFLSFIDE